MIPEFHGILRKLSHAVFEISPDVVALKQQAWSPSSPRSWHVVALFSSALAFCSVHSRACRILSASLVLWREH